MSRMDIGTLVVRAVEASAAAAGCAGQVSASDWTRWASVTFTGARHRLSFEAPPSPGLDAWLGALPEAEFAIRGHVVADLVVESVRRESGFVVATMDVLTVEAR